MKIAPRQLDYHSNWCFHPRKQFINIFYNFHHAFLSTRWQKKRTSKRKTFQLDWYLETNQKPEIVENQLGLKWLVCDTLKNKISIARSLFMALCMVMKSNFKRKNFKDVRQPEIHWKILYFLWHSIDTYFQYTSIYKFKVLKFGMS